MFRLRFHYALLLALIFACSSFAQAPLPLETLSGYGCDIERHDGRWTVQAWAAHGGERDWRLYLANQADLPHAAKICGQWMKSVEKNLKHR